MKATRGSITAPFFLSAGERQYALKHPGAYSIYRIFDLGPNPGFYKLTGDIAEILDLTPVSYQARVKEPRAHSTGQGKAGAVLQTLPRDILTSANTSQSSLCARICRSPPFLRSTQLGSSVEPSWVMTCENNFPGQGRDHYPRASTRISRTAQLLAVAGPPPGPPHADPPLFRMKGYRPGQAMLVYRPCSPHSGSR